MLEPEIQRVSQDHATVLQPEQQSETQKRKRKKERKEKKKKNRGYVAIKK